MQTQTTQNIDDAKLHEMYQDWAMLKSKVVNLAAVFVIDSSNLAIKAELSALLRAEETARFSFKNALGSR